MRYGLQSVAIRVSLVERDLREGLSVPLKFQLIEAEQLPFYQARFTPNTPLRNVVRPSVQSVRPLRPGQLRGVYARMLPCLQTEPIPGCTPAAQPNSSLCEPSRARRRVSASGLR